VLDNWFLLRLAFFGNLNKVRYIFAALSIKEEAKDQELLQYIREQLDNQE